ncbi:glycosyltransferase family A protein [Nocardioides jishulii]|uniref:Glycosyltransferase family 2 protein n=1 Tax=Nocardioides jishulii TaxID=2575440 RepID=A0A4U2YRB7_9ACTN|nr:glycosyltransferase family A protein [Nocardioides jishulii]QCX26203.1 glycosyltransferase family 2 protein [Nocardioides jishulii]TKI63996.1 glycosyltransferase family 2 protein [Nocardioides jishulii]
MTGAADRPITPGNDWRPVVPPALGEWTPTRSLCVVMPAHNPKHLATVLASLAAQTYPAELTEVVVVDDGSEPAVVLPDVRPERTRVVRVTEGWGRANALACGAAASDSEILMWLDDDMLVLRHHLEAHARWHHLVEHFVVLGDKRFVEPAEVGIHPWGTAPQRAASLTPEQVRAAVANNAAADLWDWETSDPHTWVEDIWAVTDDLATAGTGAFVSLVGATVSMTRALHDAAGGPVRDLRLGEDTVFGHQVAEAGAVLLPDHEARSWHLGLSHAMRHAEQVKAHNQPLFAHLVPSLRPRRVQHGRAWAVPFVEVVVPAEGSHLPVQACVDSLLDQDMDDHVVVLVGEWSQLDEGRVRPLADEHFELRWLQRMYRDEPRVQLLEPDDPRVTGFSRSPLRLRLSGTDLAPARATLRLLVTDLDRTQHGLRVLTDDDGEVVARLERTAAFARTQWYDGVSSDAERDAMVTASHGSSTRPASDAGFVPSERRLRPRFGVWRDPAMDADASWRKLQRQMARNAPVLTPEDVEETTAPAADDAPIVDAPVDAPPARRSEPVEEPAVGRGRWGRVVRRLRD